MQRLTGGRFGPAQYKALIMNDAEHLPFEAAEKLLDLAQEGLPVLIYGALPKSLSGVSGQALDAETSSPTDAELAAKVEALLELENVIRLEEGSLLLGLEKLGVAPDALVERPGLRVLSRKAADGSLFYFLYNATKEEVNTKVQLLGSGSPFLLDTWTGNISAITNFQQEKDHILLDVQLSGQQAIFIGIGQRNIATTSSASVAEPATSREIALNDWNLSIESWGPTGNEARPYESQKVMLDLGKVALTHWAQLNPPDELLPMAGVDSMGQISGIGYYSTQFQMGDDWQAGQPVLLKMVHSDDMITRVTINDMTLQTINPITNTLDIGPYVQQNNTLSIKLVSTLIHRVQREHEIFKSGFAFPPPPENLAELGDGPPPDMPPLPEMKTEFHYGLRDVKILY